VGNRSPHPDQENRDASDPRMLPEPAAFAITYSEMALIWRSGRLFRAFSFCTRPGIIAAIHRFWHASNIRLESWRRNLPELIAAN
jgi:hypothetical protein